MEKGLPDMLQKKSKAIFTDKKYPLDQFNFHQKKEEGGPKKGSIDFFHQFLFEDFLNPPPPKVAFSRCLVNREENIV